MSLTNEQRERLTNIKNNASEIPPVYSIRDLVDTLLLVEETASAEFEESILADYDAGEDEDKPAKKRPYQHDVFTLTRKREIKLFKRLLRGPSELTDASPETALMREILEAEGIVLVEKEGALHREYDLTDAVFWSEDKTQATIIFD